ncbi:hypothetical protein BGZ70_007099 [Mortierella alpina]|uniref:F-box domain-containing protein n=1 Tax=Mortierella alpina TaxID=64518 RepID=A0A9P6J6X6_MORAP|nr:hypothetical protein BGZ70_007099 [Mortierella alpina]
MSDLTAVRIFDIPELTSLVAKHLRKSDLVACARVSRAWHNTFIPFIYRSVEIQYYYPAIRDRASWDGFKKHSSHMRELEIEYTEWRDISLFGFNCTNLAVLHIRIRDDPPTNPYWSSDLLKLISNNPSISTLRITGTNDDHLTVLRLPRYMPGLRRLVISGREMGEQYVNEIMRCAHRLEELDLNISLSFKDSNRWHSAARSDLDTLITEFSLKDQDADVDTQDEPTIMDSEVHRYRQGTRLKKFCFFLSEYERDTYSYERNSASVDASRLFRLCCSADDICLNLDLKGEPTRNKAMQVLRDQVSHCAWCLKHLDLGPLQATDSQLLVEILGISGLSLNTFQLRESRVADELLSVLLQRHGKTLKRVAFDKCSEIFQKANMEAVLSRCSKLQLLHVFNCEKMSDLCRTRTEERRLRWTGPDGKVFKVFTSDQVCLKPVRCVPSIQVADTTTEEKDAAHNGLWRRVEMMRRGQIRNQIRFIAH